MKTTADAPGPGTGQPSATVGTATARDPVSVLSRIKLALLDEYKGDQGGYDPYDTSGQRSRDVWSRKRKRA
ncbi:MAG TPA: hypothetical protein VLX90_08725 [Steroidobacteraceae bacterium]|nr:hypothetical protein [Steroidobacteraceae bacterium]